MSDAQNPKPVLAASVPLRSKRTNYPEPFASRIVGREKRPLGDMFGLTNFGVNLTTLEPGGVSALRHWHTRQDEFIYVLEGNPTLVTDSGETRLAPGMCAGFKAGRPDGHCLINRTDRAAVYLEMGDRTPGDAGAFPDDDLKAVLGSDGKWQFQHKDGSAY